VRARVVAFGLFVELEFHLFWLCACWQQEDNPIHAE
jgi:hypothetical protein